MWFYADYVYLKALKEKAVQVLLDISIVLFNDQRIIITSSAKVSPTVVSLIACEAPSDTQAFVMFLIQSA